MPTAAKLIAAAVGAVLAVLVSEWVQPSLGATPYALLYVATFFAAWQGGVLPGLVVAGVTAAAAPPRLGTAGGPEQLVAQQVALGLVLGATAVVVGALAAAQQRHRERYAATLTAVGDAIVVTDARARVSYLNPAAEMLLGWSRRDAQGRSVHDVVALADEQTGEPEPVRIDLALREGRPSVVGPGLVALVRGADVRPVDGTTTPMRDSRGQIRGAVVVLRDITVRHDTERERQRLAREVAASRERLQQILASVPAVVWEAWGAPGPGTQQMRFVSQYLETLTGYTTDEALTTPDFWLRRMHPDDRETATRRAADLFAHGDRAVVQFRMLAKDGRELWLESLSFVVRDGRGKPVGVRGVALDVTERMRRDADRNELLARERQAREEAESANRLKDEFLMTLSHELRTPLNAILGWARLLRDTDLPPEKQRRAIETIERNARVQTQLIEDLLDMSRIVTGKVRLDVGSVDVVALAHAVVEALRPGAEAKGVRIEVRPDADVEQVPGDADRVQQVIWNLVSNAIKFTPAGGRIEVRVNQLYDRVLVAIADTGAGIEPDLLPFVFERFRQGPEGKGGLGLGLAIAKQIVELHGGTIEARSLGAGKGTTFLVKLPLFAARPSAETVELVSDLSRGPHSSAERDLATLRVLVVDPAPDSLDLVRLLIEQTGAIVSTTADGLDALALVASWMPDVLVCHLSLPGGAGFALIRSIREAEAREGRSRLPAIAISDLVRAEDRREALDAGYDAHLGTPTSPAHLAVTLRAVTRGDGREQEANRPSAS